MRIAINVARHMLGPGLAIGLGDAFAHRDQATSILAVSGFDIRQELFLADRRFGNIDQVRTILVMLASQDRGRGRGDAAASAGQWAARSGEVVIRRLMRTEYSNALRFVSKSAAAGVPKLL